METTKLQEMYWEAQTLHNKLFALENYIEKLRNRGRRCVRVQQKYFALLTQLRELNADMLMLESDSVA